MDIHVATLCDSAADYNGKLCVLGAFDSIYTHSLPAIHPQCAVALRLCFRPEDEKKTKLRIALIDADGGDVIPPFEPEIEAVVPSDAFFLTRNLVLNLQRLSFREEGHYSVDIRADGEILQRLPLRVVLLPKKP